MDRTDVRAPGGPAQRHGPYKPAIDRDIGTTAGTMIGPEGPPLREQALCRLGIGASGCRVLVTLLHEMIRQEKKTGVASLCLGGGEAVALVVKR